MLFADYVCCVCKERMTDALVCDECCTEVWECYEELWHHPAVTASVAEQFHRDLERDLQAEAT